MTLASCALALATATAAPATAAGPAAVRTSLTTKTPGWVSLAIAAPRGTAWSVVESGSGADSPAAPLTGVVGKDGAATKKLSPWSCERRDRSFTVTVTAPGKPARAAIRDIRTPSCAKRLSLEQPTVAAGRPLRLELRDAFALGGFTAHVCVSPAGAPKTCADAVFAPGHHTAQVDLGKARRGRDTVRVDTPFGQVLTTTFVARRAGAHFRLLASGDSMMQILDDFLAQRLGSHATVIKDAHISTGISKPFMFNWNKHAAATASKDHPDVTIVILGANDGFPFGGVDCCGDSWSNAYADHAADMMRSYLRGGEGRVIWLLLPTPKPSNFQTVFRAVNQGLETAGSRFTPDQVDLLDLRKTFTPNGGFQSTITWNGQTKHVRQDDGIHLNVAGASIAADLIIRQLRSDGFVR